MIKFFRKIRQKLLSENKFSRYLLYAIGEIILVVIGILIALQINNWKELQKKEILKNEYTTSLIVDFTNDTAQLKKKVEGIKENLKVFTTAKDSINYGYIKSIEDFERLYRNKSLDISNTINTYNTNTFNILVSGGNIDLFDSQLREEIMELNRLQKFEYDVSNFNRKILFEIIESTIRKYPSIDDSFNKDLINKLWKEEKKDDLPKDIIDYIGQTEFTINRYLTLTDDVLQQTELVIKLLEN